MSASIIHGSMTGFILYILLSLRVLGISRMEISRRETSRPETITPVLSRVKTRRAGARLSLMGCQAQLIALKVMMALKAMELCWSKIALLRTSLEMPRLHC